MPTALRFASRSRFVPLTGVIVFVALCAALVFTPALASISVLAGAPSVNRSDAPTSAAASTTGVRFDSFAKTNRTLGTGRIALQVRQPCKQSRVSPTDLPGNTNNQFA